MYQNYQAAFNLIGVTDIVVAVLALSIAIFVCLMPIYKKPAKTLCCVLAMVCFYICAIFRVTGSPIEWGAITFISTGLVFGIQFGICYLTYETLVPQ